MGSATDLSVALEGHRNGSRRAQRRLHAVDALCTEYPTILRVSRVPADTCILAARIGMDVMHMLGYRTKPLPVKVTAHNAAAVAIRDSGERPTPDDATTAGAFEVVLGFSPEPKPGTYNGHLIFVVDEALAVDLTAHQLSHPDRGLDIKPLYFPVNKSFLRGDEALGLEHPEHGWRVIYGPHPADKDWAASTDYDARDQRGMLDTAQRVLNVLKHRHNVKPATKGRR